MKNKLLFSILIATCLLPFSSYAKHNSVDKFYQTRQIIIITSGSIAGTTGIVSTILYNALKKYIPNITIRYMTGGGGVRAANYLYNVAAKDGSIIGITQASPIHSSIMRPSKISYDINKFNWIGSFSSSNSILYVNKNTGYRNLRDLMGKKVFIGTLGKYNIFDVLPLSLNKYLGTNFKPVTGYRGSGKIDKAVKAGEVDGRVNNIIGTYYSYGKDIFTKTNSELVPLVQIGLKKSKELLSIPLVKELIPNKDIVDYINLSVIIGKVLYMPPGVSKDKVTHIRTLLYIITQDPDFKEQMKKRFSPVVYRSGKDLQKIIKKASKIDSNQIKLLYK